MLYAADISEIFLCSLTFVLFWRTNLQLPCSWAWYK